MAVERERGYLMQPISLHEIWMGEAKCRHCAVRNSALFAGLQEADFRHIHQPIKDVALAPKTRCTACTNGAARCSLCAAGS